MNDFWIYPYPAELPRLPVLPASVNPSDRSASRWCSLWEGPVVPPSGLYPGAHLVGICHPPLADKLPGCWAWLALSELALALHLCSINVCFCTIPSPIRTGQGRNSMPSASPQCGAGSARPSLDVPPGGRSSICNDQHPCPAGSTRFCLWWRLPPQRPPCPASAGFVWLCPAYLLLGTTNFYPEQSLRHVITSAFTRLLGEKYYIWLLPASGGAGPMYLPWWWMPGTKKYMQLLGLVPTGRASF